MLVAELDGKHVLTVEGLARDGRLHPLQEAFLEVGAVQCGYCTPGMLLSGIALLNLYPHPTREQIRKEMGGQYLSVHRLRPHRGRPSSWRRSVSTERPERYGGGCGTVFLQGRPQRAESTLRCLIEDGVIAPPPEVVRMMTGFGGGMQRGTTCGAVVAAVAAIGWATGRTEPGQSREPSAAAVREFLRRFEETFGSLTCRELQAVYVKEHALKSEGMYRSCTAFVEKAVELAQDILGRASLA